jgi:hypothetical protein
MRLWGCVFGLVQGTCPLRLLQGNACCVGACGWSGTRRTLTVIAARRCMCVLVLCVLVNERMLTVNAARQCMHASECVFGLVQGAWSLWLLRGDACAIMPVCIGLHGCDLANVHMHM